MKTLLNKQTEPSEQTLKTIAHMPTKSLPVLMGDEFAQGLNDVDFMRVAVLLAQKSYEERKTGTDLFTRFRHQSFDTNESLSVRASSAENKYARF
jgi:hypothetical protein